MKITARDSGPYIIETGGLALQVTRNGKTETIDKPSVALCRCGHSSNKPFCDGTHKSAEFGEPEATIEFLDGSGAA